MKLSFEALLFGLSFSLASAIWARNPTKALPATSPAIVAVPAKPTATLPTPPGNCKKLDTCLAENGGKGSSAALKKCVMQSLGEEKGKKAWDALSKAKLEALGGKKKPSLALLKVAQPVAYKAVVAALFADSSEVLKFSELCADPEIPKRLRSPVHVSVPKEPAAALPKPPGGLPGTAKLAKAEPAAKGAPQPEKVPDAPSDCDKGKGLPTPHGHPEADATDKTEEHPPPATCQQLDTCLANIDHASYLAGYNACVDDFCKKLHGDKKFEGKDDHRTSICDDKGREAMDVLAKASAEAKKRSALIAFSVVQSVFTKDSTVAEIEHACRI